MIQNDPHFAVRRAALLHEKKRTAPYAVCLQKAGPPGRLVCFGGLGVL